MYVGAPPVRGRSSRHCYIVAALRTDMKLRARDSVTNVLHSERPGSRMRNSPSEMFANHMELLGAIVLKLWPLAATHAPAALSWLVATLARAIITEKTRS